MFLDFYQLREHPFGVTPDPRYLYFSGTHREALASLSYGVKTGRGFLALIAKPGMGKTTLLFHLLERLRSSARTVFLFQTQCSSRELFRYLLTDLGLDTSDEDLPRMHNQLNEVLLRETHAGKRVVLIIDEAQNLEDSVLETVRLLSDFETPRAKLLQIILSGQPELADKLARPGLLQLRQRIATLSHLDPFTPEETSCYIDCRLLAAGYQGDRLFSADARALIAARSGGIPRIINNLCFNALSLGYALRKKMIDAAIVEEVVADLDVVPLVSEQHAPHKPVAPSSPAAPPLSYKPIRESLVGRAAFRGAALAGLLFLLGFFSISFLAGKPDSTTSQWASLPASAFNGTNEKQPDQAPAPATAPLPDPLPVVSSMGRHSDRDLAMLQLIRLGHGTREIAQRLNLSEEAIETYRAQMAEPLAVAKSSRRTLTVVVEPHQTLEEITLSYLGSYDPKIIKQIRDLNPELKDFNRFEVGQRIRLPWRSGAEAGSGLPRKMVSSKD